MKTRPTARTRALGPALETPPESSATAPGGTAAVLRVVGAAAFALFLLLLLPLFGSTSRPEVLALPAFALGALGVALQIVAHVRTRRS